MFRFIISLLVAQTLSLETTQSANIYFRDGFDQGLYVGYNNGHDDGQRRGYEVGYEDGFPAGFLIGYDLGCQLTAPEQGVNKLEIYNHGNAYYVIYGEDVFMKGSNCSCYDDIVYDPHGRAGNTVKWTKDGADIGNCQYSRNERYTVSDQCYLVITNASTADAGTYSLLINNFIERKRTLIVMVVSPQITVYNTHMECHVAANYPNDVNWYHHNNTVATVGRQTTICNTNLSCGVVYDDNKEYRRLIDPYSYPG